MDSNSFISKQVEERKTPSKLGRVFLIVGLVVLLVSIPILPLRFFGIPGPTFNHKVPTVTTAGRLFDQIFPQKSSFKSPQAVVAAKPQFLSPVKLMDQATDDLNAQILKSPQDPSLQNQIGLLYLQLGELDEAVSHFQRAKEIAHGGLLNIADRLKLLKASGKNKEAEAALIEQSKLNLAMSDAHSHLAYVYDKIGQKAKAMAEMVIADNEGAIKSDSGSTGGAEQTKSSLQPTEAKLLASGQAAMKAGNFTLAIEEFQKLTALNPNLALAHQQLGFAMVLNQNMVGAAKELTIANAVDPTDAASHNNLGLVYACLGKANEATGEFNKAIAINPKFYDAAINLGNFLSSQGRFAQARVAYEKAIAINPRSAVAHNNLAALLSLSGAYGQAIDQFQEAITYAPNLATAHYGLGMALCQTESYIPAIKEFKTASVLDPSMSDAQAKIEYASRKAGLASR